MSKITTSSLKKLLTAELKLKSPEFHLSVGRAGLINGHIVSSTFKPMRARQRQGAIWDALEFTFGRDAARRQIGMLIAYTPDEWYADEILVPAAKPKRKKAG
jgi:hypothetical protein